MATEKPKINDRVRRLNGNGSLGVVKSVRSEITAKTSEEKEKSLMVAVLWDNGTQSYFVPEALEVVP